MKNFIESGKHFETVCTVDVAPGELVIAGDLIGVAVNGGKAGEEFSCDRTGVFGQPKAPGAIAQGEKLYWDADGKLVTKTGADNVHVGCAHREAAAGDDIVCLLLKG